VATIILIEDDGVLRHAMRRILEGAGHRLREAAEGGEGLRLLRAEPAEVVVTDLMMPGKEGIETIRELRQEFPAVRILAVSGGGAFGARTPLAMAKRLGADAALAKPFTLSQLRETVESLLPTPTDTDGT